MSHLPHGSPHRRREPHRSPRNEALAVSRVSKDHQSQQVRRCHTSSVEEGPIYTAQEEEEDSRAGRDHHTEGIMNALGFRDFFALLRS